MIFDRPIPGQSLTTEPKGAPYENPPEIVDAEEAAIAHLERLNNPDAVEEIIFFLEEGLDVVSMTQGICRAAVIQGIHSIDVSLIVAPVIHEFIKSCADAAGIQYEEGLEDKGEKRVIKYQRDIVKARKMIDNLDINVDELVDDEDEDTPDEPMQMEEPMSPPKEMPSLGLMSRIGA